MPHNAMKMLCMHHMIPNDISIIVVFFIAGFDRIVSNTCADSNQS